MAVLARPKSFLFVSADARENLLLAGRANRGQSLFSEQRVEAYAWSLPLPELVSEQRVDAFAAPSLPVAPAARRIDLHARRGLRFRLRATARRSVCPARPPCRTPGDNAGATRQASLLFTHSKATSTTRLGCRRTTLGLAPPPSVRLTVQLPFGLAQSAVRGRQDRAPLRRTTLPTAEQGNIQAQRRWEVLTVEQHHVWRAQQDDEYRPSPHKSC